MLYPGTSSALCDGRRPRSARSRRGAARGNLLTAVPTLSCPIFDCHFRACLSSVIPGERLAPDVTFALPNVGFGRPVLALGST